MSSDTNNIAVATPISGLPDEVPHGDSFTFENYFSVDDHLGLLKNRGLSLGNEYHEARFERLLNTVGYFKLSQYLKHFYNPDTKRFIDGCSSHHIVKLYRQDERLRKSLFTTLGKIECRLSQLITERMIVLTEDVYWCDNYADKDLNLLSAPYATSYNKATNRTEYKEQSTQNFLKLYPNHTRLPSWVCMQSQSFGTLCLLLKSHKTPRKLLKQLIQDWGLPKSYRYNDLYKIFDALRHLRNLCTHNQKILGENIRISPPLWHELHTSQSNKPANSIMWVNYLNKTLTERKSFTNELLGVCEILDSLPLSVHLNIDELLSAEDD